MVLNTPKETQAEIACVIVRRWTIASLQCRTPRTSQQAMRYPM